MGEFQKLGDTNIVRRLSATPKEKLACAARELAMRRNVYPKWVASGRMKQEAADREIAVMEAIVADYQAQVAT